MKSASVAGALAAGILSANRFDMLPPVSARLYNFFTSPDSKYVNEFRFTAGETPMASWMAPAVAIPVYAAVILALHLHVKARQKPYVLRQVVICHNALLAVLSFFLGIALVTSVLQHMRETSFHDTWCDPTGQFTQGRHFFYYYVNYGFKYAELADTALLVLRGRPVSFLHGYHHAATLLLCWEQLSSQTCLQWVPIAINLLIHTAMYSYYCMAASGIKVWWKKHLTVAQILQFVIGVSVGSIGLAFRVLHDQGYDYPGCWGNYRSAIFGLGVLASYLLLFIHLYFKIYTASRDKFDVSKPHKQVKAD